MMSYDVALSVAHYPRRPGAGHNGVYEHEVSKLWTDDLQEILEGMGFSVFRAPIGGLTKKVANINAINCKFAIEIHFNACGGCGASGSETLHCPGSRRGKEAAELIQDGLHRAMENRNRGVKEGWYRMDKPKVVDYYGDKDGDETPDYFLAKTRCVAVIVEPEFMEHPVSINTGRVAGVQAIARGVNKFLRRHYDF